MIKLQFLGATQTVTGSKYLIESQGKKILVDCGLFQGVKELRERNWEPLPIEPKSIEAVVLTHSHIDHTGYLPLLVREGFSGPIYATQGTIDLCSILLPDSGHLQEEEAEYANKKKFSKHDPAKPLYTEQDAQDCLSHFQAIGFEKPFDLPGQLSCTLRSSGHILGSAFVVLKFDDKSLVFSGDLGRPTDLILNPPVHVENADYLVLESTYGDRLHEKDDVMVMLAQIISRTIRRHGIVLIPAFSVGRSQEILYRLRLLKERKLIPNVPIYLNSPMSINATEMFMNHRGDHRLTDEECAEMNQVAQYVRTTQESKDLCLDKEPKIILSASGMLDGGRVLHHLKQLLPNAKNAIVLTGYQAEGTRGSALLGGAKIMKIHGEEIPVVAEVAVMNGLSAHADQQEILQWLSYFKKPPIKTFLTHGEKESAATLQQLIEKKGWSAEVPEYLEEVDLV